MANDKGIVTKILEAIRTGGVSVIIGKKADSKDAGDKDKSE